jgi:arylsulfatase A-like enzyme
MLDTVKGADAQLGRLLRFLEQRGQFDEAYIIVESDHDMETTSFVGPRIQDIAPSSGFSSKRDYYLFTGSQLGEVFLRRNDPAIAAAVEKVLEAYRWKDPITGEIECPLIVIDRDEMKSGIDKATGRLVAAPGELYSEYYVEHPRPGRLRWPDLFLFPKAHLQFPCIGAGFGNIGLGVLPFDIPPFTVYVGGHGAPSTQRATLAIRGPGIPEGLIEHAETHPSDVAPTLYMLEGFTNPASVQGKPLPGIR